MSKAEISKFLQENLKLIDGLKCENQCVQMLNDVHSFKKYIDKFLLKRISSKDSSKKNYFFNKLDTFFSKANRFESEINNEQLTSKIKTIFRNSISNVFKKSVFIRHGYFKPRGYPGDYKIIEAMYNNKPISKGVGLLLDEYFLQNDYVQAVRDRKDRMKDILVKFINNYDADEVCILNLACGSCREIREVLDSGFIANKKIHIILLDQEKQALDFAKEKIIKLPKNLKLTFVQENILNLLSDKFSILKKLGAQDLIYSIGLADYLPNSILGPMIKHSFSALNKSGELIIAHKNVYEFSYPVSDWGADWKFIPRTEKDFRKLVDCYLKNDKCYKSIFFEEQRRIFFLILSHCRHNLAKYLK